MDPDGPRSVTHIEELAFMHLLFSFDFNSMQKLPFKKIDICTPNSKGDATTTYIFITFTNSVCGTSFRPYTTDGARMVSVGEEFRSVRSQTLL